MRRQQVSRFAELAANRFQVVATVSVISKAIPARRMRVVAGRDFAFERRRLVEWHMAAVTSTAARGPHSFFESSGQARVAAEHRVMARRSCK